eukprot:g72946.t1
MYHGALRSGVELSCFQHRFATDRIKKFTTHGELDAPAQPYFCSLLDTVRFLTQFHFDVPTKKEGFLPSSQGKATILRNSFIKLVHVDKQQQIMVLELTSTNGKCDDDYIMMT